jgi:hypothetical protein
MALQKLVKVGGTFYKGHKLTISATPGDYVLDMTETNASVINGITVVPDAAGTGDYFKLEHLDENNDLVAALGETVYNMNSASIHFGFAALERMGAGHKFRLTYTNVAGSALNVYTIVERIK